MKIGIMGGTFNPIHNGHLLIAENARSQYQLDKVWFLPAGVPPHKADRGILPGEVRLEMVRLATEDHPDFAASDFELLSKERNYTYLTLERLHAQFPDTEFYFIMGGDSVESFHTWRNPQIICQYSHLLAAVRDEMDINRLKAAATQIREAFQGTIDFVNTPNFSVSSHEIRTRLQSGDTIRYLVPEAVRDYIMEHQLYR